MPEEAERCGACGADLAALDLAAFEDKLVRALWHPEPLTARRAAEILGRRGSRSAVSALLARYRAGTDAYFAADIARALGRIGGAEAEAALRAMGAHPSPIVKHAVEDASTACGAARSGAGGRANPAGCGSLPRSAWPATVPRRPHGRR